MTQDEIIAMAREACGPESEDPVQDGERLILSFSEMERFAALVEARATAKERDACAQICESNNYEPWGCARAIRARGNT